MTEDTSTSEKIEVFPSRTEIKRVVREFPRAEEITYLGEASDSEPTFLDLSVLEKMTYYLISDQKVELGGTLLGYYCEDPNTKMKFTWISGFIPDLAGSARGGTYTFMPDSWSSARREMEERARGEVLVGWVHSHPSGFAPSPSSADAFVMQNFFNEPEQLTLILGQGGLHDKKYALWVWSEEGVRFRKGLGVIGRNKEDILRNFKYPTEEEAKNWRAGASPPEIRITKEEMGE